MWVWASCSRLIQVFCGRIFSLTTLAERPPGWTGARLHSLTMLTRKLTVMMLALSSVVVTSTATDDSSEGKRLMTMWANACMYRDVCYHMRPWGFGCVQKWRLWVRLC